MSRVHTELGNLLAELVTALHQNELWSGLSPSAEALASTQPFACDTLAFNEWLQFIFIPRLLLLVETTGALPLSCETGPMAELFFQGWGKKGEQVVDLLAAIDRLISEASQH